MSICTEKQDTQSARHSGLKQVQCGGDSWSGKRCIHSNLSKLSPQLRLFYYVSHYYFQCNARKVVTHTLDNLGEVTWGKIDGNCTWGASHRGDSITLRL